MKLLEQKIPMEELIMRDKNIIERICSDDNFAYYFFHEKCRPLFSNIIWKIYDNNADYDELVNELYIYLKEPSQDDGLFWHRLRTFDYRTSLFDWIKTVAIRKFYTPSNEVFKISDRMIELGVAEELFLEIRIAKFRNYLYYAYIKKMPNDQLAEKLKVDTSQLSPLSRNAIKYFKNYLKNNRPEYFDSFFNVNGKDRHTIEINPNLHILTNEKDVVELNLDAQSYLSAMPNKRYQYVVQSIFLDGKQPEELAKDLDTPVPNIYNIKSRGIEQLRDIAILSGEVEKLEEHINSIVDDRYRTIIHSIFIEKEDYDSISLRLGLSPSQFKKDKKAAMKELKSLIFK